LPKKPPPKNTDAFVAGNYDILRERRVFSALVPPEFTKPAAFNRAVAQFSSTT
jgi:hypothetical protein